MKKIKMGLILIVIILAATCAWFIGYHTRKSQDNLPSLESISTFNPSLITFADGDDKALRESNDCSALKCCTVPSIAFRIITANITNVLSTLLLNIDIIPATININTSKSLN